MCACRVSCCVLCLFLFVSECVCLRIFLFVCVSVTSVCVCMCGCVSDILCVHVTPAQCTQVYSTCHRCTNAFALAQIVPQNRVLSVMVAERH